MKIFISDLHLTSKGTLSKGDITALWDDIKDRVDYKNCPIELVILGDFFDILKDPMWRLPDLWGILPESINKNFKNQEGQDAVKKIVEKTINGNSGFFDELRNKFGPQSDRESKITYVVGNHDRLINFVPEARIMIRARLGQEQCDGQFETEYIRPELKIYATHGHQHDAYNFKRDSNQIPVGDLIVWILINGFQVFSKKPISITNLDGSMEFMPDYLTKFFDKLDNLFPHDVVPEFIAYSKSRFDLSADDFKKIQEFWKDQYGKLQKELLKKSWKELKLILPFRFAVKIKPANHTVKKITDTFLKMLSPVYKRWVLKLQDQEQWTLKFLKEKKNFQYFIMGHTHEACVKLLEKCDYLPRYYLNTGTIGRRIIKSFSSKSEAAFIPVGMFNYLLFYEPSDQKTPKIFELCNLFSGLDRFI